MNVERIAIFVEDAQCPSGYVCAFRRFVVADRVPPDFREMIRVRSAETGVVRADDLDLELGVAALCDARFITSCRALFVDEWSR
jgi:hypothetical protein